MNSRQLAGINSFATARDCLEVQLVSRDLSAVSTHGCKSIASMSGFRSDSQMHC